VIAKNYVLDRAPGAQAVLTSTGWWAIFGSASQLLGVGRKPNDAWRVAARTMGLNVAEDGSVTGIKI
jgi:hypothetical protein